MPQRIKTVGNTLQELMEQCSSIMTGAILVTQSAGDSFVIKIRHCGVVPKDLITVTEVAKGFDEKQFEALDEKSINRLAQPKTKSAAKKKLQERMQTLLPRLNKASSALGGSGQFWFVAVFYVEGEVARMQYLDVGKGLENGKLFISKDTNIAISEYISTKMLKAVASQNSYLETPSKAKVTVKAGTPKLTVAKKRKVTKDIQNEEDSEIIDDEGIDEEESVVLITPKKREEKPCRKLNLLVPEPNQLLPMEVMQLPAKKGRGRPRKGQSKGRGRPRANVVLSVTVEKDNVAMNIEDDEDDIGDSDVLGHEKGKSKGRGRPRTNVVSSVIVAKDKVVMNIEDAEDDIGDSDVLDSISPALSIASGRRSARTGSSAASFGTLSGRGLTRNKRGRGTLRGGGSLTRGGNSRVESGHVKSLFSEEMQKIEAEIDTSEDEEDPPEKEVNKRIRCTRKTLNADAISEML